MFRESHKAKQVIAALAEFEAYDSDVLLVDGDLHVPGDLDLSDEGAYLLVVRGDLTVGGYYSDSDDPESFLLVTGHMRARDVVTAGWLEVHGDLYTGRLIGDYNDCSALIGGDAHVELFYGEEHWFTVGGRVDASVVIGSPRMSGACPAGLELDDVRLLHHFDRELLCFMRTPTTTARRWWRSTASVTSVPSSAASGPGTHSSGTPRLSGGRASAGHRGLGQNGPVNANRCETTCTGPSTLAISTVTQPVIEATGEAGFE
jgi:hypothetical protein